MTTLAQLAGEAGLSVAETRNRLRAMVDRTTREARDAALKPARRQWSRPECLAALRDFHREHGRFPKLAELLPPLLPSGHTVRRYFGTVACARRAALDFEIDRPRLFEVERV